MGVRALFVYYFLLLSEVIFGKAAQRFVRESLIVQRDFAIVVDLALVNQRVYIFVDDISDFNYDDFEVVKGIRVYVSKSGKRGVLSRAGQKVFRDRAHFLAYYDGSYAVDSYGVYVVTSENE